MKHFAILRSLPQDLSWDQVDANFIQSMILMGIKEEEAHLAWEPRVLGVKWVRSYWEPTSDWGVCLYTAKDAADVERWHDVCEVPHPGIREIEVEEAPEIEDKYPRGFHEAHDPPPLIALEARRAIRGPENGHRLIRTYRYTDSGEEPQLLLPAGAAPAACNSPGAAIHRVVEIRPTDYD